MEAHEFNDLVRQLVESPHDPAVLDRVQAQTANDARSYVALLETVASETEDPTLSSHWLTEAALVLERVLEDDKRAAFLLNVAIKSDPTNDRAGELLRRNYRAAGDYDGVIELLAKRARAVADLSQETPEAKPRAAQLYLELGYVLREHSDRPRAIAAFKNAVSMNPDLLEAVRAARALYVDVKQYSDALALIALELERTPSVGHRIPLLQEEAWLRTAAGDRAGATGALLRALKLDENDLSLAEDYAASILGRVRFGHEVSDAERDDALRIFLSLAETYVDDERDLTLDYALSALDVRPGSDAAMVLALEHAQDSGRAAELTGRLEAHLVAAPQSAVGSLVRQQLAEAYERHDRIDDAIEVLRPVVDLHPVAEQKLLGLLQRAGLFEELVARVEKAALALPTDLRVERLRALGDTLAAASRDDSAYVQYRSVLRLDPADPATLRWIEHYLRRKNRLAELRDLLLELGQSETAAPEVSRAHILSAARLCEQIGDIEGAIAAQAEACRRDRTDAGAVQALERLLERGGRWRDLAAVLEHQATGLTNPSQQHEVLEKLAQLYELKLSDPRAAAMVWSRCSAILPGDGGSLSTAATLYERAGLSDLAIRVLDEQVELVKNKSARGRLYRRLGELREASGDLPLAGAAHATSASLTGSAKEWQAAERCFSRAELWSQAASAAHELLAFEKRGTARARQLSNEATLWTRAGELRRAVECLESAVELDPENEVIAEELIGHRASQREFGKLVELLLRLSERQPSVQRRVVLLRRAATVQEQNLDAAAAAAVTLKTALELAEEPEIIRWLAGHAERTGDLKEACAYFERLTVACPAGPDRTQAALHHARLTAAHGDVERAVRLYETILSDLDPESRQAIAAIAELEERRSNFAGVASALERAMSLAETSPERLDSAVRLGAVYEGPLADPPRAIDAYEIAHRIDREHRQVIDRLIALCSQTSRWERAAQLLDEAIGLSTEAPRRSTLARDLALILDGNLDRSAEALEVLLAQADAGDASCRAEFVSLGDRLGQVARVAQKLVDWHAATEPSERRSEALRGAFRRFLDVEDLGNAAAVAKTLCVGATAEVTVMNQLAAAAVEHRDAGALAVAHELLVRGMGGSARAEEFVRQAEVLVTIGVSAAEAVQHAEKGLLAVEPAEVDGLLTRIGRVAVDPAAIIDVYERQVARCRYPGDRSRALARAAEVASEHGAFERTKRFFDDALRGSVEREMLALLESTARAADARSGTMHARRALADALASGGSAATDAGRTRSLLLRRAALIAQRDLGDTALAFEWFGEAVFARLDAALTEVTEKLSADVSELRTAAQVIQHALSEQGKGLLPSAEQWSEAKSDLWTPVPVQKQQPPAPRRPPPPRPRRAQRANSVPPPPARPDSVPPPPLRPDSVPPPPRRPGSEPPPPPRPAGATEKTEPDTLQIRDQSLPKPDLALAIPRRSPLVERGEGVGQPVRRGAPAIETVGEITMESVLGTGAVLGTAERREIHAPQSVLAAAERREIAPQSMLATAEQIHAPRAVAERAEKPRPSGENLLSTLGDALGQLRLLSDAIEAADYVLRVTMESLRPAVGMVHLFDVNTREFVAVRAAGRQAGKLVMLRTKDSDALCADVVRQRRAIVITDAARDGRIAGGRWSLISSVRCVLCAPALREGRILGLIEIADPIDGSPFSEADANAVFFVAERFAEFVSEHGLLLGETPAQN